MSDLREPFAESLFILMGVVATVLLIACANIANLLLARAAARQPEFAMRLALGAGRRRLMGQLLVESMVLALIGGACGLAFAHWSGAVSRQFHVGRTHTNSTRPDARRRASSLLRRLRRSSRASSSALRPRCAQLAGDLTPALSGGGRGTTGSRSRLRADRILAVVQVALSLTLLVGAGLFVRSLHQLNPRAASASRDSVLIVRVEPKGSDQRNTPGASARLDRTYRELIAEVESIPGVEFASMAQFTPMLIRALTSRVELPLEREVQALTPMIYPNYFSTMGIPMLAGRDFNEGDLAESAPKGAIVNETFVRQVFPGQSVVGRRLSINGGRAGDCRRGEGFAVHQLPPRHTGDGVSDVSADQHRARADGVVCARARQRRQSGAANPRSIHRLDPTLPMFEIRTLSEELDAVLVRERLIATLTSMFGVLALALACVGLYGLLAFTIAQRTTEMGVRMALGAKRGDVVLMVMREALTLVIAGTVVGLICAMADGPPGVESDFGVAVPTECDRSAHDRRSDVILLAVASLASYLPARRASRVEPMAALRNE